MLGHKRSGRGYVAVDLLLRSQKLQCKIQGRKAYPFRTKRRTDDRRMHYRFGGRRDNGHCVRFLLEEKTQIPITDLTGDSKKLNKICDIERKRYVILSLTYGLFYDIMKT